jgi:hypothetical protein
MFGKYALTSGVIIGIASGTYQTNSKINRYNNTIQEKLLK